MKMPKVCQSWCTAVRRPCTPVIPGGEPNTSWVEWGFQPYHSAHKLQLLVREIQQNLFFPNINTQFTYRKLTPPMFHVCTSKSPSFYIICTLPFFDLICYLSPSKNISTMDSCDFSFNNQKKYAEAFLIFSVNAMDISWNHSQWLSSDALNISISKTT